jgi:hypothetical protein
MNINNSIEKNELVIEDLQDNMFTSKNLTRFTKYIINNNRKTNDKHFLNSNICNKYIKKELKENLIKAKEKIYNPKQKDSLFWCFYILKHGYSNYEMEINNQYFTIEKTEKFKYIDMLRNNKDLIKLHKIKPFTELEDDLANKDNISIKTFFALCILENINVLLVDKRKIYELLCIDVDDKHPINIVHRNSTNLEHHIELNITDDIINNYRNNYYKVSNFDSSLKAMSSYKLEDLHDLCKKLDIKIVSNSNDDKKKMTKKDIYQLLVLNY